MAPLRPDAITKARGRATILSTTTYFDPFRPILVADTGRVRTAPGVQLIVILLGYRSITVV